MKNEFADVMARNTDAELEIIVTTDRDRYKPSALEAAENEIRRRRGEPVLEIEISEPIIPEDLIAPSPEIDAVDSLTRFLNYAIDTVAWILLMYLLSMILDPFLPGADQQFLEGFSYVFIFGTYIAYYFFLETRYQKTLGKYLTRTKVVNPDGSLPSRAVILTRTLCRFIPFNRISFLFTRNGFHDSLSKTKVVRDEEGEI